MPSTFSEHVVREGTSTLKDWVKSQAILTTITLVGLLVGLKLIGIGHWILAAVAITLVDLLDDIPIDASRFLFNTREAGSEMEFDMDLAIEQSAQNPVYYCQYAHARICSILRKMQEEGKTFEGATADELVLLKETEERELIRHLSNLPAEVITAADHYDPARMTRYCTELATLFHKFYNACRVNVEDEALSKARLYLCMCVKTTLANVLTMLKVSVPERM